jgi:hypothetical protein
MSWTADIMEQVVVYNRVLLTLQKMENDNPVSPSKAKNSPTQHVGELLTHNQGSGN